MKIVINKQLSVRWSKQSDRVVVVSPKGNHAKSVSSSVRITCFSDAEIKSMQKK